MADKATADIHVAARILIDGVFIVASLLGLSVLKTIHYPENAV
jgi:hypothetical protein